MWCNSHDVILYMCIFKLQLKPLFPSQVSNIHLLLFTSMQRQKKKNKACMIELCMAILIRMMHTVHDPGLPISGEKPEIHVAYCLRLDILNI